MKRLDRYRQPFVLFATIRSFSLQLLCVLTGKLCKFFEILETYRKLINKIVIRKNDTTHLNPKKLGVLYNLHFPNESFPTPVDAMYRLADIYDVQTLWRMAGWDLEEEISSVYIN